MYECLLSIEVTEPTGSWFTLSASLMFTMRPYFTDLCAFYFYFLGEKTPTLFWFAQVVVQAFVFALH